MNAMNRIRNIYCVGRNYVEHAKELNNDVPKKPMLFSKPTHALAWADGAVLSLPGDQGSIHYEAEWVVRLARPYEAGLPLEEAIAEMGLGLDLTLRDVQSELKAKGHPWLLAKGFPNSAVLTRMVPFTTWEKAQSASFELKRNGEQVQLGFLKDMIFDLPTILAYCQKHFGLGEGDLIYTGTPSGVGPVEHGDHYAMYWEGELLGDCRFELKDRGE